MSEAEARSHDRKSLPPEMASAVNLLAHPLAGFAAMGAIGFGVAGHAMGLWLGSVAGATEAVRRLAEDADRARAEPSIRKAAPRLRLVTASRPDATQTRASSETATGDTANAPDLRRPAVMSRPAAPDDLKAIAGIGPKLEKVLNGFGIWTYAQIAALRADEIAWLDGELGFGGRIARDDWLGQAAILAGARGE